MGFLGGDNESNREDVLNEQLSMHKAELEAKKQSLYQTRLDIIKGQGKQVFEPPMLPQAEVKKAGGGASAGDKGFTFGGGGFLNR